MLCRWLAVLILAAFLLVIEGIAVTQGITGTFVRDQKLVGGNVFGNHNITNAPTFEMNVPRNVTTAVGQTAFLHCRVHQLGDKEHGEISHRLGENTQRRNRVRNFAYDQKGSPCCSYERPIVFQNLRSEEYIGRS
ncbi:uncharacterized protein LOC100744814 isoform X2 [Bombus impatiens]|uniref:Uncharacterized protein LOC100744814 isoform X2 n=1 Tax=Bombus impatiens TaxID=132113 RepID=A0A6P6FD43_BOMIM|nr:uncharacterized protein LOC100744814 isoform X2 [Bombus impatiens]XP_033197765.1 uncharacterized protein LOC117160839 isoform X2 [Bombus vancouverensis nearcticus]